MKVTIVVAPLVGIWSYMSRKFRGYKLYSLDWFYKETDKARKDEDRPLEVDL